MLTDTIEGFLWRAAARKYAQRLGPQLRRDYGASDTYTPAQIAAAARRAKLPAARIRLGYACFMSEAAFNATMLPPPWPTYAQLRGMVQRHGKPRPSSGGFAAAPENADAFLGAAAWPGNDT
jgi:hypothetical protein